MKEWFKNLLSDKDAVSSKRVVGLVGATTLIVMLIATSFTKEDIAPSSGLVNGVVAVTLGCFGLSTADKFRHYGKD